MGAVQLRSRHRAMPKNRSHVLLLMAGCGALAFVVTACSSSDGSSTKPSPSQSATAKPSPTDEAQAAARKEVLAVYAGMRTEQVKAYAVGVAKDTKLKDYAADKALALIEGNLFRLRQGGVVFKGKPESTTKVTALNLSSHPKTATVSECVDTTRWIPVDKATGKEMASGNQPRRYMTTGTVRTIGTHWMVVGLTVDKEHPC
ncbi:hypothetical protein [Streptomyces sp. NPDC093097]|uniref:hypothetical protein n=1 Tax=Streptomyces sp. NPDC093097 TaxID=3366027 RepID=UPI0037F80035